MAKKLFSAIAAYIALASPLLLAGPLVTAATSINNEMTQAAIAIVGALIIGYTVFSMTGGLGSRIIAAIVELVVVIVLLENANSIGSWFRFTG